MRTRDSIVSPVTHIDDVRAYWDRHIHDLDITRHPVGSRGFFDDLDQYHFEKLHHLLRLVDFDGYAGRRVLEVGCGAGVDLARFAKGGAIVTGVDLAPSAIELARANFEQQGLRGELQVADGEQLPFPDESFDLVFAHGVVQYTADPAPPGGRVPPGAEAGRRGHFSGLQPDLVAERAVEADEGGSRARGRPGAAEAQHRRVQAAPVRVQCGAHRARALSGEIAAAPGLEGHAVQHVLRRHLQRAAALAGPPLRLASAGVLPEMTSSSRQTSGHKDTKTRRRIMVWCLRAFVPSWLEFSVI